MQVALRLFLLFLKRFPEFKVIKLEFKLKVYDYPKHFLCLNINENASALP